MRKYLVKMIVLAIMLLPLCKVGFAQDVPLSKSKSGPCDPANKFGSDSVLTIKNVAMFNQYISSKPKNYLSAYKYWSYLYAETPCYSKHITYYAPRILKAYMNNLSKTDSILYDSLEAGIIENILGSYDKRIELYGSEGYVTGKKAIDWAKLKPEDRKTAIKLFEKSVGFEGNKTSSRVIKYYLKYAIKEFKLKRYSQDSLYELYFQLSDIIAYNLENKSKKEKVVKGFLKTDTLITKMMKPYLKCDVIRDYFKPKIEASPDDIDLLKKAISLMESIKCTESPYFLELAEILYPKEPSSDAALSIAKGYHAKLELSKSIDYYLKAIEGMEDAKEKSDILSTIANLHKQNKNMSQAKKYAQMAIKEDPNNGKAHLIIAEAWLRMAGSCTADGIDGASVYWAAYDKAAKAKALDEGLSSNAKTIMNSAASRFPTKKDAFFKSFTLEQGASFTVPCLGVSTTVRYK